MKQSVIFTEMNGFTKLFGSIVTSTIWREDDKTRIVWITLLALSDRLGNVSASIPGLAAMANISVEDCIRALERLKDTDKFSRTKDHEGRRISDIDGGWHILNYVKYRELGRSLDRKDYLREKQREHRSMSTNVNTPSTLPSASASLSVSVPSGKRVWEKPTPETIRLQCAKVGLPESEGERFFNYYESNGWKVGKNPMKSWMGALANWKKNWESRRFSEQPTAAKINPIGMSIAIDRKIEGLKAKLKVAESQGIVTQEEENAVKAIRKQIQEAELAKADIPI